MTSSRALADRLAVLAGLCAALASLAGFVPGLYRDPAVVIGQSHGYDAGNLIVVAVMWTGLTVARRGLVAGRFVAVGAVGCLLYSFVTYAFDIVLNPATLLYIATLGLGGWSLVLGLARCDGVELAALPHRPSFQRAVGVLLTVIALLFAVTWLRQIGSSVIDGQLPAELRQAGWPMNPVWVLDLAFVLPLTAATGWRLIGDRPHAMAMGVAMLSFMAMLGVTILAMAVSMAIDGQPVEPFMPALFTVIVVVCTATAAASVAGGERVPATA